MRIAYIVGARPNFVKMAPVFHELRGRLPDSHHVLIHTGQHYDHSMSGAFLADLEMPAPHHMLGVGEGSHAIQTAQVMQALEPILIAENPDLVVVPGDVNSTLAATLVAAKLRMELAHLEAGLRSFDRSMPEEINRIVADAFAEKLFIHSDEAVVNLREEGIADHRIHAVGNTMIDTLVAMAPRFRPLAVAERMGLSPGDFLLVTLHRPALVDGPLLHAVMQQLRAVAAELPVVFPVHPRTRKMLTGFAASAGLHLIEPLPYLEFLSLEADAAGVLTDSGGVQEETTYLGIPCFTLRDNTERPVTVRAGTNTVIGLAPEAIGGVLGALSGSNHASGRTPPPGWDGHAARRVADVILGIESHPLDEARVARLVSESATDRQGPSKRHVLVGRLGGPYRGD